jgi:hypothetical protein
VIQQAEALNAEEDVDPAFLTFGKSINVITSLNMVVPGMIRSSRQVVTGLVYSSDLLQVRPLQIIAASL